MKKDSEMKNERIKFGGNYTVNGCIDNIENSIETTAKMNATDTKVSSGVDNLAEIKKLMREEYLAKEEKERALAQQQAREKQLAEECACREYVAKKMRDAARYSGYCGFGEPIFDDNEDCM